MPGQVTGSRVSAGGARAVAEPGLCRGFSAWMSMPYVRVIRSECIDYGSSGRIQYYQLRLLSDSRSNNVVGIASGVAAALIPPGSR